VLLGLLGIVALLATACDWTEFMGNPALNGNASSETSITTANVGSLTESFRVAVGASGTAVSSPVVSNGVVFAGDGDEVAAASASGQGCVGTPATCAPLWTTTVPGYVASGSPVVANGDVYVTMRSTTDATIGQLMVFDAAGSSGCSGSPVICQPLWTASADANPGPNVVDGKVFVDTIQRGLEVFDAAGKTGCSGAPVVCQPLWTTGAASSSLSVPSVAGGKVYLATFGEVQAFDEAGSNSCTGTPLVCSPLFTVALVGSGDPVAGSVDISGGVGYVVGPNENTDTLTAFDANGSTGCSGPPVVCQPLWTASIPGGVFGTPAVADGHVYVSRAFDPDGVIDVFDAKGQQGCSGTPVVCTDEFYLVGPDDHFEYKSPTVTPGLVFVGGEAFDASGTLDCTGSPPQCGPLWTAPSVGAGLEASATVANGTVYVGGNDGMVHAYHLPTT
jgi:hypothetical protein